MLTSINDMSQEERDQLRQQFFDAVGTLDDKNAVSNLAKALCDIPSVSGNEKFIADLIEEHLRTHTNLEILRDGDAIVARTSLGRQRRVLIAGHTDTVPIASNVPARFDTVDGAEVLWGRGSVDMKSGVATQLWAATKIHEPKYDVTWVFYDNEEVHASKNGLRRLVQNHPEWLKADFGILGEPTDAKIEGGCNGTVRVFAHFKGRTAHSARAWLGDNAVYKTIEALQRIRDYQPQTVTVDGLDYRESLSVTHVQAGHAFNSIPDDARLAINYRFAPSMTPKQAIAHIKEVLAGIDIEWVVDDEAAGARPGLEDPLVQEFCSHALQPGQKVLPKYGWTDVARLSSLGIPAVNYGPGDPMLCHTDNENCPLEQIDTVAQGLLNFLQ